MHAHCMMDVKVYNVNVGVLGHVDSGKTSLVAALSTTLSTAALDKHPQSKERGITLDLGFSSFTVPAPPCLRDAGYEALQFTLVDCPGHASLIRTVVGGAQIIDFMVLVVDVTKGIQTQTAECIVIGEIATDQLVVALNKIDQFPPEKRDKYVGKAKKLVAATLAATKFAGCRMVAVAARPAAHSTADGEERPASSGLQDLIDALTSQVQVEQRRLEGAFLFNIDHCFAIKGQGTVLTGTVAGGSASVGDAIELPQLKQQRRIKSMQVFRQPVQRCQRGDRVGICVTQLDAGLIERGLACSPGAVPTYQGALAVVSKVRFYPGDVRSQGKMHVIVGHHTVMAKLVFFGTPDAAPPPQPEALVQHMAALSVGSPSPAFDFSADYLLQDELYGTEGRPSTSHPTATAEEQQPSHQGPQWAFLQFEEPVTAPADALVIGARLDADLHTSSCRIAFHGRVCALLDPGSPQELQRLQIYKLKHREGCIERVEADGCSAICRGMFQKDANIGRFEGLQVQGPSGEPGVIEGSFGKSGKFKVRFPGGISLQKGQPAPVTLTFKRYLYDLDKRRMAQ